MLNGVHWKKAVRHAAKTDIGLRRANNQDSHIVVLAETPRRWLERGHLFVVADGMGAHAAGEVASRIATESIAMSYSKRNNEPAALALEHAVYDAHRHIREQSALDEAFRDMGTTVDAVLLLPQGAVVAHVGDSRVYRWRNHVIEQLTFDHSVVWEVCVAGNIPFDQAPSYIPKNQITRSLGPTEKLTVDIEGPFPIENGDIFLACSDGLTGQLSDRDIGQILGVLEPEAAAESLINLANLHGGPDNITVIVAEALPLEEPFEYSRPIPQNAWTALLATALCLLLTILGFVSHMLFFAYLGGAGVLGGLVGFFFAVRDSFFAPSPFQGPDTPYGQGPYTSYACPPTKDFAEKLASILQQFRVVTQGDQWDIRWKEADAHEKTALTAVRGQDYGTAIRNYCLAINHLMSELKKQRVKKSSS